jgi:hypothetical protein
MDAGGGLGSTTLHGAADNAPGGGSGVGEGISATGHALPQSTTEKPGGRGGTQGKEDHRAGSGAFYDKPGREKGE